MKENRVFFFAYRECLGPVGGGRGVVYKIYLANSQYHYIDNPVYVFKDTDFTNGDSVCYDMNMNQGIGNPSRIGSALRKINLFGIALIFKQRIKLNHASKWIRAINEKYHFTENDVYIFHDYESAYAFMKEFPNFNRTLCVYHQQGSLYSEWKSFSGANKDYNNFRSFLNHKLEWVFRHVKTIGFPSYGAYESLLASDEEINKILSNIQFKVFYNGFSPEKNLPDPSAEIKELIHNIQRFNGFKFVTVAALNYAKAVERIPFFIKEVRDKIGPLKWFIVGDGSKADELELELNNNDLKEDVCWIKKPLPHNDILNILSATDFYILFHRYSIFDYATIEAMAYGNIPILTPVGGNKEVVSKDTGLLVSNINDIDGFSRLISEHPLSELKKANIELQASKYSEESFLRRYAEFIDSIYDSFE